jgi:hypothetical protein
MSVEKKVRAPRRIALGIVTASALLCATLVAATSASAAPISNFQAPRAGLLPSNSQIPPSSSTFSIACPDGTTCEALGAYELLNGNSSSGWALFVETFSDTVPVSVTELATPQSAENASSGSISCTSAGNCIAISDGFVFVQKSGTWSIATPVTTPAFLTSVSCVKGSTFCMAVGNDGSATANGVAISYTSGTWSSSTVIPAPEPGTNIDQALFAVSCPSTTSCVAVGNRFDGNTGVSGITATDYSSGTWGTSTALSVSVSGSNPLLYTTGVSCVASGQCLAVGYYVPELYPQDDEPWSSALVSGTWSPIVQGEPPTSQNGSVTYYNHGSFNGVTCFNAGNCLIVGGYVTHSGNTQGLYLGTNVSAAAMDQGALLGPVASVSSSPNPVSPGWVEDGVSCIAATSCIMVGAYLGGGVQPDSAASLTAPAKPPSFAVKVKGRTVTISWKTPPSNGYDPAKSFAFTEVHGKTVKQLGTLHTKATSTSVVVKNLVAMSHYSFYMVASDGVGSSAKTSSISVRTT